MAQGKNGRREPQPYKYNDNDNDNIVRYTLAKLSDKEKKAGVIAASAGNHAQVSLNKVFENVS